MQGFCQVVLYLSDIISSEGEEKIMDVSIGEDCEWHFVDSSGLTLQLKSVRSYRQGLGVYGGF